MFVFDSWNSAILARNDKKEGRTEIGESKDMSNPLSMRISPPSRIIPVPIVLISNIILFPEPEYLAAITPADSSKIRTFNAYSLEKMDLQSTSDFWGMLSVQ